MTSSSAVARMLAASSRPATIAGPAAATVSLAIGEPDFDTHPAVVDAAHAAALGGHTHYTDFAGDPELRAALASRLAADAGTPVDAASVLITHGATGAIGASLLGLLDPGDTVVVSDPTYSLYADVAALAGARVVRVPDRTDGRPDVDRLQGLARTAKIVILCNPNNPTGTVLRQDELGTVADAAARHGCYLMVDEAYAFLVYEPTPFFPAARLDSFHENVLYVNTFSKAYAMTGWRVGYVVVPPRARRAVAAVHRTFNGSNNSIAQRAALKALELDSYRSAMAAEYAQRRIVMRDALQAAGWADVRTPEGAFYFYVRHGLDTTSDAAAAHLVDHGVRVRSGTEFGPNGEGHLRLSFATSDAAITEGVRRMANARTAATRTGAADASS